MILSTISFAIIASFKGIYVIYIALILVCFVFVYFGIKLMNDRNFRLDMLGEKGDSELSVSDKLKGRGKMLFLYPLIMLAFFGGMFFLLLKMDKIKDDKQYYAFDAQGNSTAIETEFTTFLNGTKNDPLSWSLEIDAGNNINLIDTGRNLRKLGHIDAISDKLFLTSRDGHSASEVAFEKNSGKRSKVIIGGALVGDKKGLEIVALDTSSLDWTLYSKDGIVYTKENIQLGKLTADSEFPKNADVKWHKVTYTLTSSMHKENPSYGNIGDYNKLGWYMKIEGNSIKILKKGRSNREEGEIILEEPLDKGNGESLAVNFTISEGTTEQHFFVINYALDLEQKETLKRFASFLIMSW